MRKLLVAIDGRANWGTLHSAIRECIAAGIETTVLAYASAVSDRHGDVSRQAAEHLLNVIELPCLVEGGPQAMAATVGATISGFAPVLDAVKPNVVLVCGDRYSVLPAAYAAALMNIVVGHVMAGEVSGTIDEGVRHAITKISHVHFPATEKAHARVLQMGEDPNHVHKVGCPRVDFVREALAVDRPEYDRNVVLVSQHAVTTECRSAAEQMAATLDAVDRCGAGEIHIVWPAADAGSQAIVEAVRSRKSRYLTHRALPPADYARLMARAGCIVGNSSSAIREGAWIGCPAVNVGTRQRDRERAANVIDVEPNRDAILGAIRKQLAHGPYASDALYGDGLAGRRIAEVLAGPLPSIQKVWRDSA